MIFIFTKIKRMSKDKITKPFLSFYSNIFRNSPDNNATPDEFFQFMIQFLGHGLLGLILGAIIDRLSGVISDSLRDRSKKNDGDEIRYTYINNQIYYRLVLFSLGIVQLLINVVMIFVLTQLLPSSIYTRWQATIPGIAFAALYFGIQSNMFKNIRAILEEIP